MIDLSFLTDAEQEAILKVLHRDAELKKAEEHRVRELQDKVDDENELKYKSGQWFYEAKSKRHRDKIHGADLVRASIRKRKSPTTLAELSQSGKDKSKRRWVNSINQDIFIPPELYGIMEPPDETEEDIKASKGENNQSAKKVNITSSETDKKVIKNGTASPIKQRKNPFNSEGSVGEIDLELSSKNPEAGQVNGDVGKKSDLMSSIKKYGVKLPYPSPVGGRRTSQGAEDDPLPKQPPVPKPRKFAINGQPPDHSSPSLQRENSFNSANKPKGILKRRSSSSSTDSESFRIPQNGEPIKLVLPTSPILEAEQNYFFNEQDGTLESFPDRQKQVRFSENVLQKPPTPNPESYTPREIGEFGILDPNYHPNEFDYGFVDEESEPTQYSYSAEPRSQNSLDENPNVALTIQTPSNLTPNLDVKKKLEDPSKEISRKGISEILDESYPEINVDSAGTEPLYAIVKKPSQSTSSDQEKDLALDDALMEPRFLGQRGKTESTYQSGQPLEFGKSFGGVGKVNYASNSPTSQHGKVYVSNNEEILDPERATDVQSSYDFVEEPKPSIQDSDYVPKWRRPFSLENQSDLLLQQRPVLEFTEGNRSKYSPEEIDTKYKSTFLHDTPDGREVTQSCNFPAAQSTPLSSKPESGNFQAQELFLRENRERKELPKSANFKVMSMKERIHDTPKEQMSNPSQFQSLKHFWNVEDKNRTKGDADTSPQRILTDVLMRNKPTRADLKQRNSKEIPADDLSLPSSFDSLSEEEQTSHKVASWLAQTPTVYGDEQVDANVDQVHPGKEVMENIEKTVVDRKNQAADFSIAIQKRTEEALQAPKITDNKPLKTETIQISPIVPSSLLEKKEKSPENLVNSAEKNRVSTGFYQRVVQISSSQSPAKQETKIVVDKPAIGTKQSPAKEVEESVERTVAPERTSNEFKIGFQKLMEEYESTKSDNENQVKESRPPTKEQQLIETHEFIDKSSVPKGNDHQEFISALKKLEIEASTPLILEDQDEQTVSISPPNQLSPVKSEYKIGFEHMMPVEDEEILEAPQKHNVTYTVQSSSSYYKDRKKIEEVVEKTTGPSRKDDGAARKKLDVTYTIKSSPPYYKEDEIDEVVGRTTVPRRKDESDLGTALKKLEQEAAINDPDLELEETYKKMTPTLQSAKNFSPVQDYESPNFNVQKEPSTAYHLENKSDLEDPNVNKTGKSVKKPEDTYGIKAIPEIEKPIFTSDGHGKLPVEEIIEKTIIDTEQSSADYRNRLMRLEEESANLAPEEPEDLTVGKSVEDPKDTYGIKTIPVIENPIYTSEGHGKLPVEEIIEKTIVDTEQSSADYRNRLMRLEEESANLAPEEPEDLTVGKSVEDPKDTYGIKTIPVIEKPIYTSEGHGKLPVEEIIEKTIVDTEQSSADYRNRLMRLEEESANLAPEEPEDLTVGKSVEDPKDTYGIKTIPVIEKPIYTSEGHGKLPVEEIIEKTIVDTEQSSADYRNRLMRLEEESANLAPEEPEDVTVGETFNVSQAPTKEVFISKRVFSSNESMPTELPSSGAIPKDLSQPQPYAYQELANNPQSPSNQSGSFSGSAGNVLYKKPETSSQVSNSKQDQSKLNSEQEDTVGPIENSFPENAEKFKRMSQSVPTFLQDETDGRETDSASESSFQIGRHKKSPSSLTNLSGSSGMASMSSVSGSVMSIYSGDFGNMDIKGAIEFSIDYAEQLNEFHIYIYQCKDLAAAEVKKQRSDPYVKSYLLPEKAKMGKRKTAVKKKTLNPVYNEILRYKIQKQSLQAQTLNLSVWHHDALGRNSFLGEVNLNLATWDWNNTQRNWYQLEPRTPASGIGLENRGEIKLALKYIPVSPPEVGKKTNTTGEVHIWIKECIQLPKLRENKINSFVKCTILPDTSRKSRQRTRAVDKTPNPIFNHTMVYDGFKEEDLREACVELTVWDHNKLSNHFLGGLRIGLGTGKSYGTAVDWMDSSHEEAIIWEKMMASPNTWIEGMLPLRMFKMAKLSK
ncbi:synaptotagmin-like protein 2 isoform X7 [Dendropsophus ebraccatus]|uniref:synaptotagmin-like protein 2 isoform X7 n=1 Tax=Dendropsophus ebraccatus TaxID=150705 RepID=UPI0038314753